MQFYHIQSALYLLIHLCASKNLSGKFFAKLFFKKASTHPLAPLLFGAVFAGGHTHLLLEGTVKGTHGIKAHEVAYFGYGAITFSEVFAGVRDSYGVDIVVEAHMELTAEGMGDIVFTDMELLFQKVEGEMARGVIDTVIEDNSQHVRLFSLNLPKLHFLQESAEEGEKIAPCYGIAVLVAAIEG